MRGFEPSDFQDYDTYTKSRNQLRRAQRVGKSIFDLWNDANGLCLRDSSLYYELESLLDDAVQIGYEAALGMPHKASDYDIDRATVIGYENQCDFCKHQYFVYNCEEECARENKGLPCNLEIKEHLD